MKKGQQLKGALSKMPSDNLVRVSPGVYRRKPQQAAPMEWQLQRPTDSAGKEIPRTPQMDPGFFHSGGITQGPTTNWDNNNIYEWAKLNQPIPKQVPPQVNKPLNLPPEQLAQIPQIMQPGFNPMPLPQYGVVTPEMQQQAAAHLQRLQNMGQPVRAPWYALPYQKLEWAKQHGQQVPAMPNDQQQQQQMQQMIYRYKSNIPG